MPCDPKQCLLGQNKFFRAAFVQNSHPRQKILYIKWGQTQVDVHTDTLIMTAHHHTHNTTIQQLLRNTHCKSLSWLLTIFLTTILSSKLT